MSYQVENDKLYCLFGATDKYEATRYVYVNCRGRKIRERAIKTFCYQGERLLKEFERTHFSDAYESHSSTELLARMVGVKFSEVDGKFVVNKKGQIYVLETHGTHLLEVKNDIEIALYDTSINFTTYKYTPLSLFTDLLISLTFSDLEETAKDLCFQTLL